jgi:hypothetical protein
MDNKSSRFNNTLRLLFLFSFGAPAIFFILQKQTQRVLWRKFDNEFLKTLQIILSTLFPNFDRDFNLQIHVSKYNDASKIVQINDKEALEYLYNLKIFKKNNKFDRESYNNFLKNNGLVEPLLIKAIKEILTIKKYENFRYKTQKNHNYNELLHKQFTKNTKNIIESGKTIEYVGYFLKKDIIPNKNFSLKEQKDAYEKLQKKRKAMVFTPKQYQGIILTNNIKDYKIEVTEEEIQNYYIKNKEIYSHEENLHSLFLGPGKKKDLEELTQKFHNGELTVEDLKFEYNGQIQVSNSFKDKQFGNMKNIFTNMGANKFLINKIPNYGYIAVAIIKEEKIPINYNNVKEIIKEKIKQQKLLNIINQDITMIQNKNFKRQYNKQKYTIKDKNDPYYSVKKNKFEIKGDQIIIFITENVIPKELIEFSKVQNKIQEYLQLKYKKEQTIKILKNTSYSLSHNKSFAKELFNIKKGSIDINNLNTEENSAHFLLTSPRDLYFIHKNKNAIVHTKVTYHTTKNYSDYQLEEKNLLNTIDNQEYSSQLKGKSEFAKSMFKYINKIIIVIKDFWDTLIN